MNDVWIINLKDNRDGHDKNDNTKFNICINSGIIAIGWGREKSRTQTQYVKANNAITNMKEGDLVWVKKPSDSNVFYLLKVIDDKPFDYYENCGDYYLDIDISKARKIEILYCFSSYTLPAGISKQNIVARNTAEMVHQETREFIVKTTNDFVKKLEEEK